METQQDNDILEEVIATEAPEGVIRFEYQLTKETSVSTIKHYDDIEFYRRLLYSTRIIGFNAEKNVGYGNFSKRSDQLEFVITASQTGHLDQLVTKHYVHIKACHPSQMKIDAIGYMSPSSESLTHYSIYEAAPAVTHIFHGHDQKVWQYMIDNDYPAITDEVEYGTLAMADAVKELVANNSEGLFVMKGHHGGFVSYATNGRSASRAIKKLLKLTTQSE